MKKETIEANDLKFREKLEELRSQLVSRQQANQNRPKPRVYIIMVSIVILMVAAGIIYLPASNTVYNQVQIVESNSSEFPDQQKNELSKNDITAQISEQTKSSQVQNDPLLHFNDASQPSEHPSPMPEDNKLLFVADSNDVLFDNTLDHNPVTSNQIPEKPGPSHNFQISQLLTCTQVKSRQCIAPQSVFSIQKHKKAHVWMEVHSGSVPCTLRHIYYHEGQKYCEVPLRLNFSRMRTWSNITLKKLASVGSWRVDIVTEEGIVIDKTHFEVISGY